MYVGNSVASDEHNINNHRGVSRKCVAEMRWDANFESVHIHADTQEEAALIKEIVNKLDVKASSAYDRGFITIIDEPRTGILEVVFYR